MPVEALEKNPSSSIHQDILVGADAIAIFLFGDAKRRQRIYEIFDKLPLFRMGSVICARKSTLKHWIECQEADGFLPGKNR